MVWDDSLSDVTCMQSSRSLFLSHVSLVSLRDSSYNDISEDEMKGLPETYKIEKQD